MSVNVVLVDINPAMVKAWREVFAKEAGVTIVHGSLLDQAVDAWVTPTNAKGSMDGGLDFAIKKHFGAKIEKRVQAAIAEQYGGELPVGHAVCVETADQQPAWLISTPTMETSSEDVSQTLNVALACAAAFQAVHMQNARQPGSIGSVALPGLGANTGQVPVGLCAELMLTGYNLFRQQGFDEFKKMHTALKALLQGVE